LIIAPERWQQYFVYSGWEGEDFPEDVIHVRVHLSIKVIKDCASYYRTQLMTVILNNGLEEIGKRAFQRRTSLKSIIAVKAIKE
jgi:hypothetical protein